MKLHLWFFIGLALALSSCRSSKEVFTPPVIINEAEVSGAIGGEVIKEKEAPIWAAKSHSYKASATRSFDLLHTSLELSFDWEKRHVLGMAELQLHPYFYASQKLTLDAKGFDIHELGRLEGNQFLPLTYSYDENQLHIQLDTLYHRTDTLTLRISYTAKPYDREVKQGVAVSDDRGLYFINHDSSEPNRPQQIWTQGETQANSAWFPTIDQPNERSSQEIKVTVEDRFTTISNGLKISSTQLEDGRRTDHWKQKEGHAPYLFALAIGEFAEIKDEWRGKEVNYYVEKEYGPYAKRVFGHTPEMLSFFSDRLGVPFPWEKYSQVVVRDFVSGAMENTGCVLFYDALNQDIGENIDNPQDDIIAHELFHHWFGDLVTCESWANTALNEAFASYGEYLWFEHKYGKDRADYHLQNDLNLYLMEAQSKREPLIRFGYEHPDDMFDRHSYQKGSCILHMLRNTLGDEAFFESLKRYLNRYAYQSVEVHQLRMIMEEVSGQDLNWFFNQWWLSPGHPELRLRYEQELELTNTQGSSKRLLKVHVRQTQDTDYIPVFRLPTRIQVMYFDGSVSYHPVVMETRDTTFILEAEQPVSHVLFDGDGILIAELDQPYEDIQTAVTQLRFGKHVRQKDRALTALTDYVEPDEVIDVMLETLKDPFWSLREDAVRALRRVEGVRQKQVLQQLLRIAKEDAQPDVRAAAVSTFADEEVIAYMKEKELSEDVLEMSQNALKDSSYQVIGKGLEVISLLDPQTALKMAREMDDIQSDAILGQTTMILMEYDSNLSVSELVDRMNRMSPGMEKIQLTRDLSSYLEARPESEQQKGLEYLMALAAGNDEWWMRWVTVQSLETWTENEAVAAFLIQRSEAEEVPQLKGYLEDLVKRLNIEEEQD